MKSFRDIIKDKELMESPVGLVGRTKDSEAAEHIENSNLAKEFRKIVKKLGGKNVARQLLSGMNTIKNVETPIADTVVENNETPSQYLRNAGYKIKADEPTKKGKELVFYKKTEAESAFEDLKSAGFGQDYNINLANNTIVIG